MHSNFVHSTVFLCVYLFTCFSQIKLLVKRWETVEAILKSQSTNKSKCWLFSSYGSTDCVYLVSVLLIPTYVYIIATHARTIYTTSVLYIYAELNNNDDDFNDGCWLSLQSFYALWLLCVSVPLRAVYKHTQTHRFNSAHEIGFFCIAFFLICPRNCLKCFENKFIFCSEFVDIILYLIELHREIHQRISTFGGIYFAKVHH